MPAGSEDSPTFEGSVVRRDAVAWALPDGRRVIFAVASAPHFDRYGQSVCVMLQGLTPSEIEGSCRVYPSDREIPLFPEPELGGIDKPQLGSRSNVMYWTGLPESTATVTLFAADGSEALQRSSRGAVVFLVDSHSPNDTMVARDKNGTELARRTWSTAGIGNSGTTNGIVTSTYYTSLKDDTDFGPIDLSKIADLTDEQNAAARTFANATMSRCITLQGDSAWLACLRSTDDDLAAYYSQVAATRTTSPTTIQ
jgi:hypothetical protein